jgi:hypothetical protein
VSDHALMCITFLPLDGISPKDRTRCLWVTDKFSHFAPKVHTIQTAKTPFVHYRSFFRHTGRGLSNSEVSFTGWATLLSCQQKLKWASENISNINELSSKIWHSEYVTPLHIRAAFQSQRKTCALKPENDSKKRESGGGFRGRLQFNGRNETGHILTDAMRQATF